MNSSSYSSSEDQASGAKDYASTKMSPRQPRARRWAQNNEVKQPTLKELRNAPAVPFRRDETIRKGTPNPYALLKRDNFGAQAESSCVSRSSHQHKLDQWGKYPWQKSLSPERGDLCAKGKIMHRKFSKQAHILEQRLGFQRRALIRTLEEQCKKYKKRERKTQDKKAAEKCSKAEKLIRILRAYEYGEENQDPDESSIERVRVMIASLLKPDLHAAK